jgi:hypothetical protein
MCGATPRLFVAALLGCVVGCGGQFAGGATDDAGNASRGNGGNPGAGGTGPSVIGVEPPDGASPSSNDAQASPGQPPGSGITCTSLTSTGTNGANCQVQASQRCSDGTTYTIACSCATGRCSCSESASNSGSSGGANFSCPPSGDCTAYGYSACGFPSGLDAGTVTPVQPAPSCPGLGPCPAGSYSAWFGDGMGNGGGGCMNLPAACKSNATCGCLADAGVSAGCSCTDTSGSVAVCCN